MLFQFSSVQQYAQTARLQQEWEKKRQQINTPPLIEQMIKSGDDQKKSAIVALMNAGKRLTQSEKEYLRNHDPNLYHQAVTIEEEQRSFKMALQNCKTKDEANGLYFNKVCHFSNEMTHMAKSVPQGAALQFTAARSAAIGEAFKDFKAEGKYSKLPTEQELMERGLRRKKMN